LIAVKPEERRIAAIDVKDGASKAGQLRFRIWLAAEEMFHRRDADAEAVGRLLTDDRHHMINA